ncbi:MAG TPA: phosphopyruvate hydratase [Elusimicrobia bacterium]|nr:phosphopyruvate hydratase [Elusimicrobiota bacterium]HBT61507.1 phosphopyruvate hydratase [Elusimicrobiota bacterium]
MSKIQAIRALEILDSRGFPTVEAEVTLDDGTVASAAVPSGASTGEHEAVELRDGDKTRFNGKGVLNAVSHVCGPLQKLLQGKDPREQSSIDRAMIAADATPNKGKLGANALLSVSMAVCRAAAASAKLPLYVYMRKAFGLAEKEWLLPTPMLNVINGGKHADSGLDVQEFMLVPVGAPSFAEGLRAGAEIYQVLKKTLSGMQMTVAVGDEGGFAPQLKDHASALDVLTDSIVKAGYKDKVRLSLDSAASEFYKDGAYQFEKKPRTAEAMTGIYGAWQKRYGIISFEDPLAENDWAGWKHMTDELGAAVRIIGDDLFVTNPERLNRGIREKTANAILIKLNQIGTVTETVEAVLTAQKAGYSAVISHRSGETEDAFIADFSVALNAGAIKTGAPCRSERLAKYNQLLRIERELGAKARYAGAFCFKTAANAVR